MTGSMSMGMGTMVLVVALVASATVMRGSEAQSAQCAANLVPCASYLNTTGTPPDSCCNPLRQALTNDLTCLCAIFNSPSILNAFNINLTQALQLPQHCGITTFSTNLCSNSTAGIAPSASSVPPPPPPPATPGSDNSGVAHGANLVGASGFLCLLLFWWSLVA